MTKEQIKDAIEDFDQDQEGVFNRYLKANNSDRRLYSLDIGEGSEADAEDVGEAYLGLNDANEEWVILSLVLKGIGGKVPC